MSDPLAPPGPRADALAEIGQRLLAARRVVLTTHLNADGDGTGSQAATVMWLREHGVDAKIVNPTPFPETFRFLLPDPDPVVELGEGGEAAVRDADVVLVLDTSEPPRVGRIADWLDPERTLVIDHHPPGGDAVGNLALRDPTASATGELIFDLLTVFGAPPSPEAALALYVAIVSDTGSFRFANTTPRIHRMVAELLELGIDPELVFQQLFATFPLRRVELVREALGALENDPQHGITWISIPLETAERLGAAPDDFEGLVDYARSVEGTRVAILFRETPEGRTKVSLRSSGDTDVNRIAREFGGGGHVKSSGAVIDAPLDVVVAEVVGRVREYIGRSSEF